jgi:hypothetical protein
MKKSSENKGKAACEYHSRFQVSCGGRQNAFVGMFLFF